MHALAKIEAFFQRQPSWAIFAQASVQLVVVAVIDYLTGFEMAFYPFYAVPILFALWFGSGWQAVVMCVGSALAWWYADLAAGHVYHPEWMRAWDALVRLMFFGVVTFAGTAYRQQRAAIRARVALLERSRQLEQEIISVSERERQGIGRDLHDGMCQYLAAIGLTADLLRQDLAGEGHPRTRAAGEITELLQDAVERARELARGLSPVDRDEGGLESALEELASSTARLTGAACDFLCTDPVPVGDNIRAIHLFRIAQEAVGNAIRHGRAGHIVIALESSEDDFCLRISDDGRGFDPATLAGTGRGGGGMGLNIMRYRARMVGGTLEVYPNSPTGVVVSCTAAYAVPATSLPAATGSRLPGAVDLPHVSLG